MEAFAHTNTIDLLKQKIAVHQKQLERLNEEKNILQLKIKTLAELRARLDKTVIELGRLERFLLKKDSQANLKGNSHYKTLTTEREKILSLINSSPVTENSAADLNKLQARISSVNQILTELNASVEKQEKEYRSLATVDEVTQEPEAAITSHVYEIPWKDVSFGNNSISFKLGGKVLEPITFAGSTTSMNANRDLYSFRDISKLLLQMNSDRTWHIQNKEVLGYIVHFLGFLDRFPRKEGLKLTEDVTLKHSFSIEPFKNYNKDFYRTYLPQLFTPYYFGFLCEHAVDNLPIIPVPETIVNSAGTKEIQESFLFPLINGESAIIWILESAENSKASLLFRTSKERLCEDLQQVFEYLVKEDSNKRSSLIKNKALAKQLGLRKRIPHKDQSEWRMDIKGVLRYAEYPALI